MIIGNDWIDANRQELLLTELNAIAVPDRWKESVKIPAEPFPHRLADGCIVTLELPEHFGQMLDYGRRLEMDVAAVDQNGYLAPSRQAKNSGVLCIPF